MISPDPYDTLATVADPNYYFRRFREWSDDVRAHTLHARDLRYGPSADETLDLIVPHTGAPLVVWFHGGYWRRFHKDDYTFVARGFAPHGIATAIVNYGLAPAVPLEEIVAQAQRSLAWLRANAKQHGADPSRIVVAGHSAGGHLAAMCAVDAPVAGVVTLSGLHDLRTVALTYCKDWLQLDHARAAALSPTLLRPAAPTTVIARAGALETYAFKEQGRDFAEAWRALGCETSYADTPADNHFTIVERLADPNDPLTIATADLAVANRRRRTVNV
ncbi:MAG TPA: alpha/beta hydrolase [Candidatus Elarobacter sp.]|jgi:arylformamidase|nr:alpha/beta hydrolase [Candidatus Elarobacter sp.]